MATVEEAHAERIHARLGRMIVDAENRAAISEVRCAFLLEENERLKGVIEQYEQAALDRTDVSHPATDA